jgi:hypothetical protein
MLKRISLILVSMSLVTVTLAAPVARRIDKAASAALRSTAPARCTGANLTLKYDDTDAAMGGVRSAKYEFKNIGAHPCTLEGFPKLQLLNHAGHVVHANLVKHSSDTPKLVTLAHNGKAYFTIDFNSGGAGHEGPPCPSVTRERIWVPGVTKIFSRHDEIDLCNDVEVSPVTDTSPF